MRISTITILFLLSTACSDSSEPTLTDAELAKIYVHVALIHESEKPAGERDAERHGFLEAKGLTYEMVEDRLALYRRNPQQWERFYAEVLRILDEMAQSDSAAATPTQP